MYYTFKREIKENFAWLVDLFFFYSWDELLYSSKLIEFDFVLFIFGKLLYLYIIRDRHFIINKITLCTLTQTLAYIYLIYMHIDFAYCSFVSLTDNTIFVFIYSICLSFSLALYITAKIFSFLTLIWRESTSSSLA